MSPRLKVSSLVVERLKKLSKNSTGRLYGVNCDQSVYVLGFILDIEKPDNKKEDKDEDLTGFQADKLLSNFPADVNICGVFKVSTGSELVGSVNCDILEDVKVPPVIIKIDSDSKDIITEIYEKDSVVKVEHSIVNGSELSKLFLHLRLTATIPLSTEFTCEPVQDSFNFIQEKVKAGCLAFFIEDSNVYIFGDQLSDISGVTPQSTVDELFSKIKSSDEKTNQIPFLNVSMYFKSTNNDTSPQLAPVIKYVKKVYKHAEIQLSIDTLAMVPKNLNVGQLYPVLAESVSRNLSLNETVLLQQLKCSECRDVAVPRTYHFFLQDCSHFLSISYPLKKTADQLKKIRETFHELLSLPMDKPLLRKSNAFDFSELKKKKESNLLLNPHEGLPESGVQEGEPSFVQGLYAYHHYMQDDIDDNGWGCAYRSLQTIFSWFRLQGYTNMAVPSHKEIQQCLVDIGDKPSSFVGSKQWIGSTEVSFVLDTMLGVTSRILNLNTGEEMLMKGGELSYHFKTQGTPIMIGGGVLAHTIIGVDYNRKTGAMKFLILDPHYTGTEDLKVVQGKGWCGWKGPEFWKKDAFYNMCLPLRPKCV